MIKLIVSDLDETLLNHERHVDALNKAAISRAMAQNVLVMIATGRGYYSTLELQHELQLNQQEHAYSITFNGGLTMDNKTETIIASDTLDPDLVHRLFDHAMTIGICFEVYTLTRAYVFNANDDEKKYISVFPNIEFCTEKTLEPLKDQPIFKVIFESLDQAVLKQVEAALEPELKRHLNLLYSSSRYLECVPEGCSKGNALQRLCKRLSIDVNDVLAIGDNHNDLSMLECAGYSATVANALEEVKTHVDYCSPYDHNHNAVADILQHFDL